MKSVLISDEYCELNRKLHAQPRGFGNSGRKHAAEITAVCAAMRIHTILDYGCGAGTLKKTLHHGTSSLHVSEYDPAIAGKEVLPRQAELVVCTDVLEHVEPEKLDLVLHHILWTAKRAAFLVIATAASSKKLEDGRNAHLIVESPQWWITRLQQLAWEPQSCFIRYAKEPPFGAVELAMWLVKT